MNIKSLSRVALLSATALATFSSVTAFAEVVAEVEVADEAASSGVYDDAIVVTATRRSASLQDVPMNIQAMSADQLQEQGVSNVREMAAFTPGLTVQDTGPGSTGTVVMRGLTASDMSATGTNNSTMLATYMGEVPLYLDVKFIDIERVETLFGPQGTLYGAGTMSGAMRYIPARPNASKWEGSFTGRMYDVAHASDPGFSMVGHINVPIIEGVLAFRSAVGYYNDPGFIDYTRLVREPGVSNPQPIRDTGINRPGTQEELTAMPGTPEQMAANMYTYKDANSENTLSMRNSLGFFPTDGLNIYLTHLYQRTKTNGRQYNQAGVVGTGKYESAKRFLEPSTRESQMFSAEVELDIGDFAQLVSATGYSERKIRTQSDATDMLIDFNYAYEQFPEFVATSNGNQKYKQFTQEFRLVSKHGGPLSWTVGAFYNRVKFNSESIEHVPGFPAWAGIDRPDNVEYYAQNSTKDTEKAVFGELTLEPFKGLTLTAGGRYFDYSASSRGGSVLPLLSSHGLGPNELYIAEHRFGGGESSSNGSVWKFNAAYKFSDNLMAYGTISKGYRIGGPNRPAPCPVDLDPNVQNICALPEEMFFAPDTILNKEIGVRATLFDRRLMVNLSAFHIDWDGIQLGAATVNGNLGITVNGGKAVSQGFEGNFVARPFDNLRVMGSFSYTDAHLTEDVIGLLDVRNPLDAQTGPGKISNIDALAGDRLPGSAKTTGAIGVTYTIPMPSAELDLSWTTTFTGNMVSRLGYDRAAGVKLPAYSMHRASIAYKHDDFTLKFFIDNIFDKYALAAVSQDLSRQQINDGVVSRYFSQTVVSPRKMGLEFTKNF